HLLDLSLLLTLQSRFPFFSFTLSAPSEIYTLSLHDALPICLTWPVGSWATLGSRSGVIMSWLERTTAFSTAFSSSRMLPGQEWRDRKSTRLNSSHQIISYAVFCLKKKKKQPKQTYAN